jgi:hypothetical protein
MTLSPRSGKISAGALMIGMTAAAPCAAIVDRVEGKKFVSVSNHFSGSLPKEVQPKFILCGNNDVCHAIFKEYLPRALENSIFKSASRAEVVVHSLRSVQKGLDNLKQVFLLRSLWFTSRM